MGAPLKKFKSCLCSMALTCDFSGKLQHKTDNYKSFSLGGGGWGWGSPNMKVVGVILVNCLSTTLYFDP